MTDIQNIPGLFGKIPTLGDFVSRRLTPGFIETWDQWLQRGVSASKEQLGAQWVDVYLSSPVWHFLLSAGVCGPTPWTGIMMPSVDKVGRYFPLTLAVAIGQDRTLADIFTGAVDWFQKMEALALSVLEDNTGIAELDSHLKDLGEPDPTLLNVVVEKTSGDAHDHGHPVFSMFLDAFEQMTQAVAHIGYYRLTGSRSVFTLWWTAGSVSMKPCLRVYDNLPSVDVFSTLLYAQTQPANPHKEPVDSPSSATSVTPQNDARRPDAANAVPGPEGGIEMAPSQWTSAALTATGKNKDIHADAYLERSEIGLWAVADGVPVHPAGSWSSHMVINALGALMATGNLESYIAYATECLRSVNTDLFDMAGQSKANGNTGTSVVVMLAVGERCAVIRAGSSRLYRYRDNTLTPFTPEDSPGGALGVAPDLSCDQVSFEAEPGDLYLLCSDGLVSDLSHQDIETIMKQGQCRACTQSLIDLALERGAGDNVTAVVSRVQSWMGMDND